MRTLRSKKTTFLRWRYQTGSKGQRPFALLSAARQLPWRLTCHQFRRQTPSSVLQTSIAHPSQKLNPLKRKGGSGGLHRRGGTPGLPTKGFPYKGEGLQAQPMRPYKTAGKHWATARVAPTRNPECSGRAGLGPVPTKSPEPVWVRQDSHRARWLGKLRRRCGTAAKTNFAVPNSR